MERDKALQSILDSLTVWAGYTRLPPRLEEMYPDIVRHQRDDVNGMVARLNAMKSVLAGRSLGSIIDLGGNAGYFSLSLIDSGMATSSTVYDSMTSALAAGRHMAELLKIDDKIKFVERDIDLEFIKSLPNVDTFICLNFLHNAGVHFDVERVREMGWDVYVRQALQVLRGKAPLAIVSVGLDSGNPVNWSEPLASRARSFARIAEDSGWSIRYYANIGELERLGIEGARDRFVTPADGGVESALKMGIKIGNTPLLRPFKEALKGLLRRTRTLPKVQNLAGTQKYYHLYILEAR